MGYFDNPGKIIIFIGFIIIILGLIINFTGNIFSWFGNLPGDIHIKKKNMRIFFPITSLIIISLIIGCKTKTLSIFEYN